MNGHKIRLGMVGGGNGSMMGDMHRLASARNGNFHFVAGALSSTKERADESAKRAGLAPERSYASFEEMAAAEAARPDGVEAVAILTPNHLHAPVARAFMAHGVHIICEKPMTATREEAEDLATLAAAQNTIFLVTHSYTGFPMVRRAREIVRAGALGEIRSVRASYFQNWMADLEHAGATPGTVWRTDPARSGIAGTLSDIGSHAFHIATYVTGLELEAVAAELSAFGALSALDNDASLLLRFKGGARGGLWCSQIAAGDGNGLTLAVHGSKGALRWSVETPNELHLALIGKKPEVLTLDEDEAAEHGFWTAQGFTGFEAYFASFARLYADAAELIAARKAGRAPDAWAALSPGMEDGLAVMRFLDAAVRSSKANAAWTSPD
ncbi:MAG: Gfo/Idh/MocA family oxidoreductase [Parvibaculum sp.]|uniref:Gfo/Idh/MocA family protein n=1 Tax=Parvibaculum sp. TaxID=2024848 RepID=UPI0025F0C512|nr:Gfo/Idh/MocA family oxidoreductase [Parvibaculum sp.]MCE9650653.1 Gfo/Idh/MocA family oxidoreductase [Parvibaculum sp.]